MQTFEQFCRKAHYGRGVYVTDKVQQNDYARYLKRVERRGLITEISVGDGVILPNGELRRITYCWDTDSQLTVKPGAGSFYIAQNGLCSFSGSLSPLIDKAAFSPSDETRELPAWFFSEDLARADGSVHCDIPFRIWNCSVFPSY